MKKLICLLMLATGLNAQEVVTMYPTSSAKGTSYIKSLVDIDASSSDLFWFDFGGGKGKSKYSGYIEAVIWADTMSTASVSGRDSLLIYIEPLFYNTRADSLQQSYNVNDTTHILLSDTSSAWGTNHTDGKVFWNQSVNLPPCDGALVKIETFGGGQGAFLPELRKTADK